MQRRSAGFVERLPLVPGQPWFAYLGVALLALAATGLRFAISPLVKDGVPFITFLPTVILSTFLFGAGPGTFAALLGALSGCIFFLLPGTGYEVTPRVIVMLGLYALVMGVAIALIHFMQRVNYHLAVERERSRELAATKDLLFRELQHRVSNNLQVVAAMLALQRRQVDHEVARRALDDASSRLALIGKISRTLYDPAGTGQDIRAFLNMLCDDIVEASGRKDVAYTVAAPEKLMLESHIAVPLALIVAEAVSNAIEHGLPDRAGEVRVSLDASREGIALQVADNGKGVADEVSGEAGNSLGLRIAGALASQLGGRFRLGPGMGGGAVARLDLPPAMNGSSI